MYKLVFLFPIFQTIGGHAFTQVDVTIRPSIMQLLRKWNESAIYSKSNYDYQYLQFLLLEAFGTNEMALKNLSKTKLEFVRGWLIITLTNFFNFLIMCLFNYSDSFRIRVKGNDSRQNKFDQMVKQKCDDCAKSQQI